MKTESHVVITLTDRDIRAAQVNGGLRVELPPNTTVVIVQVMRDDAEAR